MKKSFIQNIPSTILALFIITLLSTSCSSDDSPAAEQQQTPAQAQTPVQDPDPAVEFTKFDVNHTDAYTDQKITIEFDGNGYTNLNITSSNPAVVITKLATTVFEISSTTTTNAYINVTLNNKTKNASKGINVNFYEHGVKDFNTVEGIKVNVDKSSKVLSLLGEPDDKTDSTTPGGDVEIWNYATKGIAFYINKTNTIVDQINVFSSNYYFINKENININFTNYPYEIGNSWSINSSTTTMDMVVTQFGAPSIKSTSATSSTNRTYQYTTKRIVFCFYSDSEDNYTGKKISYFSTY